MKPVQSFISRIMSTLQNIWGNKQGEAKPLQVSAQPTPTPPPAQAFTQGFNNYGSVPAANYANEFAASAAANPLPDPYLPAVLAIMETGGGRNMAYENNLTNWGMQDMPSIPYMIDRMYSGIGSRFPYYQDYMKSGNLQDFFNSYTPPGPEHGNPTMDELLQRYNAIRQLFPQ